MKWSTSVATSVSACKQTSTPLLILIEPAPSHSATPSPSTVLSNLATKSLHTYLFPNGTVQKLLSQASITLVKLIADLTNHDYVSFLQFFQSSSTPDMLLISCHGQVLWRKDGYVSPRMFVQGVGDVLNVDTTGWFGEREYSAKLVVEPPPQSKPKKARKDMTTSLTNRSESKPLAKVPPLTEIKSLPKSGMSLPTPQKSKLQARLPNGESVTATHLASTPFHKIRSWLSEAAALPSKRVLVATAFPRQVYDEGHDEKTLMELGLVPSASLIVSDLGGEKNLNGRDNTVSGGRTEGVGGGVFAKGRRAVTSVTDVVSSFVGSFFATPVDSSSNTEGIQQERERVAESDDENLRYNGNSTQYGYDDR